METLNNYDNAYAEVLEVLNYISIEDYNKIPKSYIKFIKENCNNDSSFKYNIALPFEKQNISDKAKDILGMIFRLFIISQDKKDELNAKDKEIKNIEEKNMQDNLDNLLKKNNIEELSSESSKSDYANKLVEVKKETTFEKIITFIKKKLKIK